MTSLLDVAPLRKEVTVQGQKIEVGGISAMGVAHLLQRFPEVRQLFSGRDVEFTPERIAELAPDALKSIIAAGVGHPGEKEYEDAAERLPVGDQADLITAIIELTLPEGIGPFVEKLHSLLGGMGGVDFAAGGKDQDTK